MTTGRGTEAERRSRNISGRTLNDKVKDLRLSGLQPLLTFADLGERRHIEHLGKGVARLLPGGAQPAGGRIGAAAGAVGGHADATDGRERAVDHTDHRSERDLGRPPGEKVTPSTP